MKYLLIAAITFIALIECVVAGRPIILEEAEACAEANLVVIANVSAVNNIPADDPFGGSSWRNFGFTKFAHAEVQRTLLGTAPDELWIYGGKMIAGTAFKMEEGQYLVLLTKVKDDAYRAVDWHYSFMPTKDGKVSWLVDRFSEKREWIFIAEATRRITAHQAKSKSTKSEPGDGVQPDTAADSKSKGNKK